MSDNKNIKIKISINGHNEFLLILDEKLYNTISFSHLDSNSTSKELFQNYSPQEIEILLITFAKEAINIISDFNFPNPIWIDFLVPINDFAMENSLVFHYKSGSNYLKFYTRKYRNNKDAATKKLLKYYKS